VIGGGTGATDLANGNNNFVPVFNNGIFANNEGAAAQVMPVAGTISQLNVRLSGTPGAGRQYTFFLRVNGADTSLTCIVADAATSCADTTHSVAIAAGSLVSVRAFANGNPSARSMGWTALFAQ
jgi:hypothetical protein